MAAVQMHFMFLFCLTSGLGRYSGRLSGFFQVVWWVGVEWGTQLVVNKIRNNVLYAETRAIPRFPGSFQHVLQINCVSV